MKKNEFKKIVKHEFEKYGFKFKGNIGHKMHQENYLIGIDMEHFNFVDAYCISYGVVYLPDEEKFPPFKGFYDWHDDFLFTKTSFDNIYNYSIYPTYYNDNLTTHFFYKENDSESLIEQLKFNIENKLSYLDDYYYVLRYYSENLDDLSGLPMKTIKKLCNIYDFDRKYIESYRIKWKYKDVSID